MSVPPPDRPPSPPQMPQAAAAASSADDREVQDNSSEQLHRMIHLVEEELHAKLEEIKSREVVDQLRHLQGDLRELSQIIQHSCELQVKLSAAEEQIRQLKPVDRSCCSPISGCVKPPPKSQQELLEDEIAQISHALELLKVQFLSTIERLIQKYRRTLNVDEKLFQKWIAAFYEVDAKKLQEFILPYLRTRTYNHCLLKLLFCQEMERNIRDNKREIFKHFFPSGEINEIEACRHEVEFLDSDPHHGGKSVAKISFYSRENKLLFSIFYKPRGAEVDREIIAVFDRINQLPLQKRSTDGLLPVYAIRSFEGVDGPFSLWEAVDGEIREESTFNLYRSMSDGPEKECFFKRFTHLENVCKFLGVSDLHGDNVLYLNFGTTQVQIIPIDLESIQPGKITGMWTSEKPMEARPLTPEEENLLERVKRELGALTSFRFIPVATNEFLNMFPTLNFISYVMKQIKEMARRYGYSIFEESGIEEKILADLIKGDIPYFTVKGNCIYHSTQTRR